MSPRRRALVAMLAASTAVAAAPALGPVVPALDAASPVGAVAAARADVAADVAASLPTVATGALPGPRVLYDRAPYAPQLENTGIWQAEPILVSGATAYRDGEWLYQDWILDDHGARGTVDRNTPYGVSAHLYSPAAGTFTYPLGEGYAHNAADLVELRARLVGDDVAFRVTLNTMLDPELAAFTIALAGPGDAEPVSWPHGAGVASPATRFLTVNGTRAELADASGAVLRDDEASVDTLRRQVEVRVPLAELDLDGDALRVTIGVGLWDAASGAYLAPAPGLATDTTPGGGDAVGTAIVNVGPRTNEQEPFPVFAGATMGDTAVAGAVLAAWWREQAQSQALTLGDVSAFSAVIDLTRLAEGVRDDSAVPTSGAFNRILASRYVLGQGIEPERICFGLSAGIDVGAACDGRFVGQLQPYTVHLPDREVPAEGWGTTLLLHALSANQNQYLGANHATQLAERGAGHIVVTPGGRGPDGFYKGLAETDTFEVWNDVARHYPLNGDVVAVSGYSMGGYGTYRMLARWPDLFAAGFSVVGVPGTAGDQLASLRNHRLLAWNALGDELVQVTGAEATHADLTDEGIDHEYWLFPGADHLTFAGNDEYGPGADFLGDLAVDRAPRRVSYVVDTSEDNAGFDAVADHAYWLSGIVPADPAANATLDAVAGEHVVTRTDLGQTPGLLTGGFLPAMPYVVRGTATTVATSTPGDTLRLELTNVARVVVDVARAGVSCDVALEVTSDVTTEVVLAGCGS